MVENYNVFISYSRSASAQLACDIERGLQRLAKPWNQLRAVRVFRDDSAMAANPGLWQTIQRALAQSEWLVLLATRESAQSEYVNQEITEWLTTKSADHILLVHAGGTISWDTSVPGRAGNGDFHQSSTAIPYALRSAYVNEPRWVDLSWYTAPDSLGREDPRFIDRLGDLAAPIRGMDKEQLIGEDIRQHRRTRRLARSGVAALAVLLVLSLIAGVVAFLQRSSAIEQRNVASEQSLVARSRQLAATAVDRSATDLQSAMLLAATAYRSRPEAQTLSALHRVVSSSPQLVGFYDFGAPVTIVEGSADTATILAGTEFGKVISLDRDTGERTELLDIRRPVTFLGRSNDGRTVVASGYAESPDDGLPKDPVSKMWRDGEVTELPKLAAALSPSGDTIILAPNAHYNEAQVSVWRDGRIVKEIPTKTAFITLPDDNTVMGIDGYGDVMRTSLDNAATETSQISMGLHMFGGSFASNGNRFTFIRGGDEIEVWEFGQPMPEAYGPTPFVATTGSSLTRSVALSDDGARLATAGDGTIFVSEVVPRGQQPTITELRGAGGNVNGLKFLAHNKLLSVAGQTVALWDLGSTSSMTTTVAADLYGDCNACPPATTVVSPNGSKAVVNPVGGYGTIVNFDTGWSSLYLNIESDEIREIYESDPAVTWLDDDHLFVYSATEGKSWILDGDRVDRIVHEFTSRTGENPINKASLRDDGKIVMAADGYLLTMDPTTGASEVGTTPVDVVSADGLYAASIRDADGADENTDITIVDTKSDAVVRSDRVEGTVNPLLFIHDDDSFVFFRSTSGGRRAIDNDTELLRFEPDTTGYQAVGRLGHATKYTSGAAANGYLYAEGSGEILQFSLTDASRVSLLSVLTSPAAENGLALSANGMLVVESEPTQQAIRLPVAPESWVQRACTLADRDLTAVDLENILDSTERLQSGCGAEMPS